MNTDTTLAPEAPLEENPVNEVYKYSGFWRRVLAYSIDAILLGIIGLILGFIFYDYFLSIGQAGRLYGLVIYLAYFATLNSERGGGQTFGKRLLSIKVVGPDAQTLRFPRTLARQSIIAAPIFLNGLILPAGLFPIVSSVLLAVVVFGIGGAIGYFLLFNTKTRRTLHDFICCSHVIKLEKEKAGIEKNTLWKGHIAILGFISTGILAAAILVGGLLKSNFDFNEITTLYNKLNDQENIKRAGVHVSTNTSFQNGQKNSVTALQLVVTPAHGPSSKTKYALQVLAIAMEDEAILPESDIIAVTLLTGFDLGIARKTTTQSLSDSPANWKSAIRHFQEQGIIYDAQFSSHTEIRF